MAVILIDVQRMTTTLTTAMAEGAEQVRVFREIEEVQRAAEGYAEASRLRGGERGGQKIDGFDGDNSPRAYLRSALDLTGKTLLFTTTNGSKAAQYCDIHHRWPAVSPNIPISLDREVKTTEFPAIIMHLKVCEGCGDAGAGVFCEPDRGAPRCAGCRGTGAAGLLGKLTGNPAGACAYGSIKHRRIFDIF